MDRGAEAPAASSSLDAPTTTSDWLGPDAKPSPVASAESGVERPAPGLTPTESPQAPAPSIILKDYPDAPPRRLKLTENQKAPAPKNRGPKSARTPS